MQNPFSLSFGKKPINFIDRSDEIEEIKKTFCANRSSYQAAMITGVRGSGKTVLLSELSSYFKEKKDWVVIDVSIERDIIKSIVAFLYEEKGLISLFKDAKLNFSIFGSSIELDNNKPLTDITLTLSKMLKSIKKANKKVLITIDEVINNKSLREFVSMFQIYIRDELPIYLLMTGLYENIYNLENEKTLTFLYRSPKIELKSLNINSISSSYRKIFNLDEDISLAMAKETKGYPYAYQVLGYLCFKYNKNYNEVIDEYSRYLEDYSYEKIYSELSDLDKKVLVSMSKGNKKVEDIRKEIDLDSNEFTVYRKRLLKKGIVYSPSYGNLEFTLPRFAYFIKSVTN